MVTLERVRPTVPRQSRSRIGPEFVVTYGRLLQERASVRGSREARSAVESEQVGPVRDRGDVLPGRFILKVEPRYLVVPHDDCCYSTECPAVGGCEAGQALRFAGPSSRVGLCGSSGTGRPCRGAGPGGDCPRGSADGRDRRCPGRATPAPRDAHDVDAGRQRTRLANRLEQLKKQHEWGDLSDADWVAKRDATKADLACLQNGDGITAFDAHRARVLELPAAIASASPERREELARIVIERVVLRNREVDAIHWVPAVRPFFEKQRVCPQGDSNP